MGPDDAHADVLYPLHALRALLADAWSVADAAAMVADFIVGQGCPTPSLYLEVGGRLRCYAVRGYWQTLDGIPPTAGVIGRTFRQGRPTIVNDVTDAAEYLVAVPGMTSEVAVPILDHSGPQRVPIGVLNIEGRAPFPPSAVAWLEACAQAFSERVSTLGGRPLESPQQQLARLTLTISASTDAAASTQLAAAAAVELSGLSSSLVALTAPEGSLETWAVAGPLGSALAQTAADDLAEIATYVRGGTSAYTVACAEAPGFAGRRAIVQAGANRAIFVPMMIPKASAGSDQLDGLIITADEHDALHRTDVLVGLELLAAHVAICLRTTRAMDALAHRADRDSLTGLHNRAVFHRRLEDAIAELADEPRVVVLLIDFDHFKRINDSRGHAAGDDALRAITDAMTRCLGVDAPLFRVGGDEFAVIAKARAHRAHRELAEELVASVRATCPSTISIGVTELQSGDTIETVMARCDKGLYAAKRNGRDNWVFQDAKTDGQTAAMRIHPAGPLHFPTR